MVGSFVHHGAASATGTAYFWSLQALGHPSKNTDKMCNINIITTIEPHLSESDEERAASFLFEFGSIPNIS